MQLLDSDQQPRLEKGSFKIFALLNAINSHMNFIFGHIKRLKFIFDILHDWN